MSHNTYLLNKLVRDNSLANMEEHGTKVVYRTLNKAEKRQKLLEKLVEEVSEATHATPSEFLEELADLLEIIKALAEESGASMEEMDAARQAKALKRGDFSQGYFVEKIHCPVGSYWDTYCAKDPKKYIPE